MKYCKDLCEKFGTILCCAECKAADCEARCDNVEYGARDIKCKLLEEKEKEG